MEDNGYSVKDRGFIFTFIFTTFTSFQNAAYSNKVVCICWVDYTLEGFTFTLRKCDFSRMFHTDNEVVTYISIYCSYCFWSVGFALCCKRIFFDLF